MGTYRKLIWLAILGLTSSCSTPVEPFDYPSYPSTYPISYLLKVDRGTSRTLDSATVSGEAYAYFQADGNGFRRLEVPEVRYGESRLAVRTGGSGIEYTASVSPVAPSGAWQVWRVTGTALLPSIIDSVRWFTIETAISSPALTDTVSLSKGLTVRWTTTRADSARVYFSVGNVGGETPYESMEFARPDTDSLTITATELTAAGVTPGLVRIAVLRERTSDRFGEGTRRIAHVLLSSDAIIIRATE